MNTDFKILWFEDTDEWFNSIKGDIEEYLTTSNFKPHIYRYKSIMESEITSLLQNVNFDLVFADLKLDNKQKGGEAIKFIREKQLLADALFYSTDGVDKIKESINNEILEGIYLSNRDDIFFIEKAKKLMDKLIKRSEDIINVRGLLMDNVSEFDEKLKDIIKRFLSISSPESRTTLNEYAYDKVKQFYEEKSQEMVDLCDDAFIINAINNSFILDSYKLSMIVNKIFKEYYPSCSQMKNFHDQYSKCILSERNKLAHAKKEPEDNGVFYFQKQDGEKIIYDSSKCSEIREHINYYNSLLDEIIEVVN